VLHGVRSDLRAIRLVHGPDTGTKDATAEAFWSLLLRDPENLADFEAGVFHPGAGVWLEYACEAGELFLAQTD
jgi:hypothetical protein